MINRRRALPPDHAGLARVEVQVENRRAAVDDPTVRLGIEPEGIHEGMVGQFPAQPTLGRERAEDQVWRIERETRGRDFLSKPFMA